MIAILRNGKTVTGRLAEIFVSRKVAVEIPEEQPTETDDIQDEVQTKPDVQETETVDALEQPVKAKVLVAKNAKKSVKKAGRPPKKK